jgi:hypothetical protein
MQQWENTMRSAQKAFDSRSYHQAISLNQQALDIAMAQFQKNCIKDVDRAVAAVMVSYFSLVDAYVELADFNQAYAQFQHCFKFITFINKASDKTPELDRAISLAANKLKMEWFRFHKYHSDDISQHQSLLPDEFQKNMNSFLTVNQTVH